MKATLLRLIGDLRYLTLSHRRYKTCAPVGADEGQALIRRYGNAEKRILCASSCWHVIGFKDGHKELAYLRVLRDGFFSGKGPAIYRGRFIPHRIDLATFHNISNIRLAF
jgi:hypothetical protein